MKTPIILFFLLILNLAYVTYAVPQLPMIISGQALINSRPAKIGTEITARINDKTVYSYNVAQAGAYTIMVQDAQPDDVVEIYVRDIKAAEAAFGSGKVEKLNLDVRDMRKTYYAVGGISLLVLAVIIIFMVKIRKSHKLKKSAAGADFFKRKIYKKR